MKKIFFLVCFGLFLNNAHSTAQQPATIDYETVGNDWTWTVFANGAAQSPTDYSVVENPLDGVINSSAHVAKLVVATDASRWAGVITADIPPLTLDENN